MPGRLHCLLAAVLTIQLASAPRDCLRFTAVERTCLGRFCKAGASAGAEYKNFYRVTS